MGEKFAIRWKCNQASGWFANGYFLKYFEALNGAPGESYDMAFLL